MKLFNLVVLGLVGLTIAHPGPGESRDNGQLLQLHRRQAKHGLQACKAQLERRGVNSRAESRRRAAVELYREKFKLDVRDASVVNKSHHSDKDYSPLTSDTVIFQESNSCILEPEAVVGPYYVPGEYVRTNVREDQPGVPVVIEAQFLDVETCEPLHGVWWDYWHCNATGVYSGVVESGNGDASDPSNINATYLRGIWPSDHDGVVRIESVFPGHYANRTTHHHMVARMNSTIQPNGTLTGGTAVHVGQVYWDQDLIYEVEKNWPYNTNNISFTTNADDLFLGEVIDDHISDPFFNYVLLGSDVKDGLFGWITLAINTSAAYDPAYSFVLTESGGVAEEGGEIDWGALGLGNATSAEISSFLASIGGSTTATAGISG